MYIGYWSVIVAELWGVYQGLVMAWDHGIRWLLVEVDSQCVFQMLNNLEEMTNEILSASFVYQRAYTQELAHFCEPCLQRGKFCCRLNCELCFRPSDWPSQFE